MPLARGLFAACIAVALLLLAPREACAWIENHVLGDEITVRVDDTGKALIEHRIRLHTNGNVRFRTYTIAGIDRDAVLLSNSYVVPAREAHRNSLETATPLTLELVHPSPKNGELQPARLKIQVDDKKGLRRGTYLLVIRYRTDLLATGCVRDDGAFTRITWASPIFEDGFDNARTTFILPRAPTPPRGVADMVGPIGDADDEGSPTYLTEVRRGDATDEVELLRTYAPKGEAVVWAVRIDPRALTVAGAPGAGQPSLQPQAAHTLPTSLAERPVAPEGRAPLWAGLMFLLTAILVWLKAREVSRLAADANAEVPACVPLPGWARAPLAAAALTGGVALQLAFDRAVMGACLVVVASALTAYRSARLDSKAAMRGPGKWLTVTVSEALRGLPRPVGGWLDFSTWRGKLLLIAALAGTGFAAWLLGQRSFWHAVVLGADAVFLLTLFGTGMGRALPPDMTVEPARFLAKVLHRLRKRKDLEGVRIVPRIRIPIGEVDADEVRLLLAPRAPLRGFVAIEIGLTYAVGMGARVAMPEVLLRVVSGSACEQAVAAISRIGRASPGRRQGERSICLAPRFPTVRMTAEIAAAVAIRVIDREVRAATELRARAGAAKRKAA